MPDRWVASRSWPHLLHRATPLVRTDVSDGSAYDRVCPPPTRASRPRLPGPPPACRWPGWRSTCRSATSTGPSTTRSPPPRTPTAVPGARVRVRFAGRAARRLRAGAGGRRATTTATLTPLHKVVSAEPVLTPEVAALVRGGGRPLRGHASPTWCGWPSRPGTPPPRRRRAGRRGRAGPPPARPAARARCRPTRPGPASWPPCAGGRARGRVAGHPQRRRRAGTGRPGWPRPPGPASRAAAARCCVVPDQRDVDRLEAACAAALGPRRVAALVAEAGPAARYRAFLAALRGRGAGW